MIIVEVLIFSTFSLSSLLLYYIYTDSDIYQIQIYYDAVKLYRTTLYGDLPIALVKGNMPKELSTS